MEQINNLYSQLRKAFFILNDKRDLFLLKNLNKIQNKNISKPQKNENNINLFNQRNIQQLNLQDQQIIYIYKIAQQTTENCNKIMNLLRNQRKKIYFSFQDSQNSIQNFDSSRTKYHIMERKAFIYKALLYLIIVILAIILFSIVINKIILKI